jgi:hypothetical protein
LDFKPTFLFFFACPKNEPKKGKKSNASPRKAYAPLAGFLGGAAQASPPRWSIAKDVLL